MRIKNTQEAVEFLKTRGATCSPGEAAAVLGGQPYEYNVRAKNGKLDLDYTWHGRSLRIYTASVLSKLTATTHE